MKLSRVSFVAGVFAVSSLAAAAPVVFRTLSAYPWNWEMYAPANYHEIPLTLDVRNPVAAQNSTVTPQSVFQTKTYPMTSGDLVTLSWGAGAGTTRTQISTTPISNFSRLNVSGPYNVSSYEAPTAFTVGSQVSSVGTWRNSVMVAWTSGFGGLTRDYTVWEFDTVNHVPYYVTVSNPADFYTGLKLQLVDGVHYGWMHVVWTSGPLNGQGARYTVVAWGYESTPNTPVTIPCASAADFNGDATIDFFDYLDFVDAFSIGAAGADFNMDGSIDFFDYLDFVDAYSTDVC